MDRLIKPPMKNLLVMVFAASLCVAGSVSAQNNSGLYKPARGGGSANVQFGGQGGAAGTSANRSSGTVKSRGVSKYYAERCLKPGPNVTCKSNGDCIERPKPSVCSDEVAKRRAERAERAREDRPSAWAAARERRAAENAQRKANAPEDTGNKAGVVRIGAAAPARSPAQTTVER